MSRRSRLRRVKHTGARALSGAAIALLVAALIFTGTGVAAAIALSSSWLSDLPSIDDPTAFDVAQTTRILSADGVLLANLYLENRQVVTLDQISEHLLNAVVAVEDERFYQHKGVDFIGIARAVVTNATTGKNEGASTLTQQYIRNTVLADERFEISLRRKAREAVLALQLEQRYDKQEILGMYINTVYYGEGAYGAESAALTFFNKHASELTIAESALIAGLPQAPSRLSPYSNPEGAVARRQWVLAKMHEQGYIDDAEYEAAKLEPLTLGRSPQIDEQGIYAAPYFVAHVKKLLQDEYGTSLVFKGGLTVYTTLDTRLQTYAEEAVASVLDQPADPDSALVAIDPNTGYIKALVGGRDWQNNKFNFATQARRQPGSSFKVFTLVTALEEGMPPSRLLNSASPAEIPTGTSIWKVGNAEGGSGRGWITLQAATVGSVNTAFARLIAEMGAERVALTARRMGIESEIKPYLSITLGSQEVSPLEMASAFGTLAASGKHYPHTAITKIVDAKGETIFQAEPKGEQVLDQSIAYAATQILKGVITGGTATRANIGRPAAGKTGTTQDYRDAWFVGYTPTLVASVWMGYTPERPMNDVHGRRVFGGTFAAPIWHNFMEKALADVPVTDFPSAPSPKYTWKDAWNPAAEMPSIIGMTQEAALKAVTDAGFVNVQVAADWSDAVPIGMVCAQDPAPTGKEAAAKPDPTTVTVTITLSLGPRPPETTSTPTP